jgi:hypothetical protein
MPAQKNKNARAKKAKKTASNKNVAPSTQVEDTPVESTPVEQLVEAAPVQTGGSSPAKPKRVKKSKSKAKEPVQVAEEPAPEEPVTEEPATELATVTETVTETEQTGSGKKVRSFKVRLPGNETYEGRFTGLTPYQAANKALSKYYRETKSPKKQIQFTIRESTRGSKRGTYTYNGQREKLTIPVEYSIKDGRTITKNYKNRLTKVKKAELESLTV